MKFQFTPRKPKDKAKDKKDGMSNERRNRADPAGQTKSNFFEKCPVISVIGFHTEQYSANSGKNASV
jgi:hypothetical protein